MKESLLITKKHHQNNYFLQINYSDRIAMKQLKLIYIRLQILMNFMTNNYQKVNTFSRSIQMGQIFTYSLIISQFTIFLAAIQPNYVILSSKILMNFFMALSFCVLVITCYKSSSIDPVDSILLQFRNGDQQKIVSELHNCFYCDSCNSYVKKTSKHCKICDRCVQSFDHHCKWINNCIGLQNYYWFIVMIISAFFYMLFYCISVGLLHQQENWSNFMPSMIVSWIIFAITMPFCLLLLALICFHINLIRLNLTTYDYIMLRRAQDQKKVQHLEQEQPDIIFKTEEKILPSENKKQQDENGPKGVIFQKSEDSSDQNHKIQTKKGSTKHQNTNSEAKSTFQRTNEKQIKDFFKKHKSMKFLIGQSLIVENNMEQMYFSRDTRERQAMTAFQKQKPYRSINYKDLQITRSHLK